MTETPQERTHGPVQSDGSVFTWLEAVRNAPRVFAPSLAAFEYMVFGFYEALRANGIMDPGPSMLRHFRDWVGEETEIEQLSIGWGAAIDLYAGSPVAAYNVFFALVDRYKCLQPTVVATVTPKPHQTPTGRKLTFGGTPMTQPRRIEVIRYMPLHLHHLRFWLASRVFDNSFLYDSNGGLQTALDDALQWVEAEMGIPADEWTLESS